MKPREAWPKGCPAGWLPDPYEGPDIDHDLVHWDTPFETRRLRERLDPGQERHWDGEAWSMQRRRRPALSRAEPAEERAPRRSRMPEIGCMGLLGGLAWSTVSLYVMFLMAGLTFLLVTFVF